MLLLALPFAKSYSEAVRLRIHKLSFLSLLCFKSQLDVLIECQEYLRTPAMLDKSGKFVASEDNLNNLEGNLRRACEETSTMVPR